MFIPTILHTTIEFEACSSPKSVIVGSGPLLGDINAKIPLEPLFAPALPPDHRAVGKSENLWGVEKTGDEGGQNPQLPTC